MRMRWIAPLVLAVLAYQSDSAQAVVFTCSTIATRGTPDPSGGAFKSSFDDPAINGSGDVVFISRPQGQKKRLYLYPGVGAPSVIATAGDAAPVAGFFSKFDSPSINDDADLAFHGDLAVGEGVYVRQSAGALTPAARTSDPSPGGGFFGVFPMVSDINAAGDVAFTATVDGGPAGVFLYDATSATLSSLVLVGDATGDGRQFCDFSGVDLGDGGDAVVHTTTQVNCADTGESPRDGIYEKSGLTFTSVAQTGDATPIGGTTFKSFLGVPEGNASGIVGIRARTAGTVNVTGLFDFFPGPTITVLIATGDAAPGTTGFLRTIAASHLTDANRQAFRGRIKSGTSRAGIFIVGGGSDIVVLDTDPVPTDLFASGASYRRIEEDFGIDRSGQRVAFSAKVHNPVAPHSRIGLFRCVGS